jgi:hypothetical protein
LGELEHRRQRIEHELRAAVAAEEQARHALAALQDIAARASLDGEGESEPAPSTRWLSGAELRQAITRVALRRDADGKPVHWKIWLQWLRDADLDAAGKRAEATFLTQLARSPLVRRTDQDGIYILDVGLLAERRWELLRLHDRLARLPPPDQLALIGDVRGQRRDLQADISRAERALEEAWRMLTEELGDDVEPGDIRDPAQLAELWRERSRQR